MLNQVQHDSVRRFNLSVIPNLFRNSQLVLTLLCAKSNI